MYIITGYHECEKQKLSINTRCKNLTADTKNTKTIKPLNIQNNKKPQDK